VGSPQNEPRKDQLARARRDVMKEIEFAVPRNCNLRKADKLIEEICARQGLQLAMKGTTASFPGSIHWHFNQPKQ
jgi:hypothetical protein